MTTQTYKQASVKFDVPYSEITRAIHKKRLTRNGAGRVIINREFRLWVDDVRGTSTQSLRNREWMCDSNRPNPSRFVFPNYEAIRVHDRRARPQK